MKQSKRDKLTKLGYRVTSTQEFLGLTTADLSALSADFERPDYVPRFSKPPASE